MKTLTIPEKHQLRIARATMRMHCAGARIMGGLGEEPHRMAVDIIHRLTGVFVNIDKDCTCFDAQRANVPFNGEATK